MNGSMLAQASNLFLLQDLENSGKTAKLAESDLSAFRTVADWFRTFVAFTGAQQAKPGQIELATLGELFVDEDRQGKVPALLARAGIPAAQQHAHVATQRARDRGKQPKPRRGSGGQEVPAKIRSFGYTCSRFG